MTSLIRRLNTLLSKGKIWCKILITDVLEASRLLPPVSSSTDSVILYAFAISIASPPIPGCISLAIFLRTQVSGSLFCRAIVQSTQAFGRLADASRKHGCSWGSLTGHDVWMSFHSRSFYTTVAPADGLLDGTNDLRRHENNSRVGRRDALYSPATSQGVHLSWAEDPCAASCWPQANYKFLKQIWMQTCLWL